MALRAFVKNRDVSRDCFALNLTNGIIIPSYRARQNAVDKRAERPREFMIKLGRTGVQRCIKRAAANPSGKSARDASAN